MAATATKNAGVACAAPPQPHASTDVFISGAAVVSKSSHPPHAAYILSISAWQPTGQVVQVNSSFASTVQSPASVAAATPAVQVVWKGVIAASQSALQSAEAVPTARAHRGAPRVGESSVSLAQMTGVGTGLATGRLWRTDCGQGEGLGDGLHHCASVSASGDPQ